MTIGHPKAPNLEVFTKLRKVVWSSHKGAKTDLSGKRSGNAGLCMCQAAAGKEEDSGLSQFQELKEGWQLRFVRKGQPLVKDVERTVWDGGDEEDINLEDMDFWFNDEPGDLVLSTPPEVLEKIENAPFTAHSDNWAAVRLSPNQFHIFAGMRGTNQR
jgi:hypothetical protein